MPNQTIMGNTPQLFSALSALDGGAGQMMNGLLQESGALIAIQDPDTRFRYTNAAFREAFFVEADENLTWEEMLRRNFAHKRGIVLDVDDFETWVTKAMSRRGKVKQRSFQTDLYDGRWLWNMVTTQSNGWILYVGTDVTDMRGSQRELRKDRDHALAMSQIDELTGISSRRHIMSLLEAMIEDDQDITPERGCACLLDIDFFKRINDELGHQTGDRVLREFARTIRRTVRLVDGLGRVGGEEFLLIMPGADVAQAKAIIDDIYQALSETVMIPEHKTRRVTFSAGLTQIKGTDRPDDVFKRADNAMYEAKGAGRYRLHLSPDTVD